jgi:hypothetical protein
MIIIDYYNFACDRGKVRWCRLLTGFRMCFAFFVAESARAHIIRNLL